MILKRKLINTRADKVKGYKKNIIKTRDVAVMEVTNQKIQSLQIIWFTSLHPFINHGSHIYELHFTYLS